MGFPAAEKEKLLALKGVGETVIARLEQIGFSSLSQLVEADSAFVTKQVSQMMGSTCWHNSPKQETPSRQSLLLHRKTPSEIGI